MTQEERFEITKNLIKGFNCLFDDWMNDSITHLLDSQGIEYRVCSKCSNLIVEGYCIEDGEDYYCSDKCLESEMTKEEYNKLYDNGKGNSYWTQW